MKKIMTLLTAALLAAALALPAVAAEGAPYADIMELYGSWPNYNYPDYVCGVWVVEGGYMVALVEGPEGEAGKQEILSLIEDDSTVFFTTQTYSYRELREVQREIDAWFEKDVGFVYTATNEMENVLTVGVDMTHPDAAAFVEEMSALYGDMVAFKDTEGMVIVADTVGRYPPGAQSIVPSRGLTPGQVVTAVGVIGLAGAFWLLLRSRRMARSARMADGRTVTAAPAVTRKETEAAVKNLTAEPDTTMKDIMEKLEE